MIMQIKRAIDKTRTALEFGYRIARGIDYETLSQYILKINQHRDMDGILREVSCCLKEILDYELFGFALKKGSCLNLWIDPRAHSGCFAEYVSKEFGGQNVDYWLHDFRSTNPENSHNPDALDFNSLISYGIMDNIARLYILPRRRMLDYHDSIISTIVSSINIALEKNLNIQQLENAAAIDPLTNCYNRRALDRLLESDIAYARRHHTELSVIMVDVDNFKDVNDAYGHQAGDAVLKALSLLLPSLIRKSDYVARFGGEEFLLVLPGTTLYPAVQLAEKLRKKIAETVIAINGRSISITASFGAASLENKAGSAALLGEADERLYKAKDAGKNMVVPSLLPCFADRTFTTGERMNKYPAATPAA